MEINVFEPPRALLKPSRIEAKNFLFQLTKKSFSAGISGTITLSLVSYAFRNTVGFIYTNDKRPDMVKIAYMDFWGRRIDSEMNIDDVVPFSELPKALLDSYVTTLRFHHDHPKLKLIYKFGGVNDMNEFAKVFGIER